MTNLGTLGGNISRAVAINEREQIICLGTTTLGETHAFLWENETMTDLGTLGGTYSVAMDINNRGQILGVSSTASGEIHIFLWENGVMTDLAPLNNFALISAINERGQVVGADYATSVIMRHAYLWEK